MFSSIISSQQATTSTPRTAVILQPSPGFLVRPIHPVNKLPLPKLKPRVPATTRAAPPPRSLNAKKDKDQSRVKKSSKKSESKDKDPPSVSDNVEEGVKNKGARYAWRVIKKWAFPPKNRFTIWQGSPLRVWLVKALKETISWNEMPCYASDTSH